MTLWNNGIQSLAWLGIADPVLAAGVSARLQDGTDARGDVLIGADGIFSTVRRGLFPGVGPAVLGYVAWRGIATFSRVRWPVGVSLDRGKDEILEYFSDLEGAAELIRTTEPEWIVRNRLYDLRSRRRWASGRVVLIGDAAHAMRLNLGQGACTAIEDAVVLAQTLGGATDVPAALRAFERARRRRVRSIHRWSEFTSRGPAPSKAGAHSARDVTMRLQPDVLNRAFFSRIVSFTPTGTGN